MKEYTFDLKLFATLTFEAKSEAEARRLMRDNMFMEPISIALDGGFVAYAEPVMDGEPDLIDVVAV